MTMRRAVYRDMARGIDLALTALLAEGEYLRPQGFAIAVRTVATALKHDNNLFRYDHFYAACGLDSWGYVPGDQASPERRTGKRPDDDPDTLIVNTVYDEAHGGPADDGVYPMQADEM